MIGEDIEAIEVFLPIWLHQFVQGLSLFSLCGSFSLGYPQLSVFGFADLPAFSCGLALKILLDIYKNSYQNKRMIGQDTFLISWRA